MKKYILITLITFVSNNVLSQEPKSENVKFYEPLELTLNTNIIKPHRIELKEVTYDDQGENLESYTYVTVDPTKQFGEEMFLINWMAVTKFGTGLDLNYVSKKDLSVKYRLTPKGLPWGHLIESHAFKNEVNVIEVNADVASHIKEIKKIYPTVRPTHQKPSRTVKHQGYNSIIWPYVLASMNLKKGMEFIVPGFNTYANEQFYYKLKVLDRINYMDLNGKKHSVYEVEGIAKVELNELYSVKSTDSYRKTSYFVSNKAPYFYGKTEYHNKSNGKKNATRSWTLSGWELITINPQHRIKEVITEWEKLKKQGDITIPWYKN